MVGTVSSLSSPIATTAAAGSVDAVRMLVENKAGVLTRVAALFSRRGFNIVSLAVSPTEDERFSRMTIVVNAEEKFGVTIPDDEVKNLKTVGDAVTYITSAQA